MFSEHKLPLASLLKEDHCIFLCLKIRLNIMANYDDHWQPNTVSHRGLDKVCLKEIHQYSIRHSRGQPQAGCHQLTAGEIK